ncbi:thiol-disulfide isomerase/thioredoxin [Parabacteroides sp. PFB2-12]|uniref:TlpA family protein disulfide reductase n=1 Tax=unclassified Parabacteroides TaxID=2649774 RepID=UPI0024744037|nr:MULTISPECIES: TlpA family protein disulfide reductase [unclassified Parabacteroides]MDH6343039.1 thiol-disulfide isomerase/thioredoxin [Parabacteroides sp. PM6-13]MDH6390448.1 thiol-disulfide isomerase/thioredoxin [Parabacteroides sp. PFB2-12]
MRELGIKSVVVLFSLLLLQCKSESNDTTHLSVEGLSNKSTIITGNIQNRHVYPDTKDITIDVSQVSGEARIFQIKAPINDDGTFSFEIDLARPQDLSMPPYLDFLWLIPGDSLHVEIDFNNLLDVRLSGGKSAEVNRDFFKYFDATAYRNAHYNYRGVGTDCEINCSWSEIREKLDEERRLYRDRRQAFLQENSVCDEVVSLTEAMIELDYYRSLFGSWSRRQIVYGKETMSEEALMNELNDVAVTYFHSDLYANTHFHFIVALLSATGYIAAPETDADFVDLVKKTAKTDVIKDFMFTVLAAYSLVQKDLDGFEKYSVHVDNDYLLDRLMQEYRMTRIKMENPEDISSYLLGRPKDFTNTMSLDYKNLLDQTIAPNHGKVQIINISASWCAPCKVVLGELVKLMEDYGDEDLNVSFICITPDNSATRAIYWEKGIHDSRIHFATDDEYQFLATTFSPMSFPYGILVNRKGVIVDYGTHVRPSKMLREKIDLLLEQDKLVK